ncbi:MlaA family lipoprotein [Flocculibacter collagenilyticus]|uniref:MlaA family lipoprotein n=1 Tax=Flocculibacter collagenilyticus TaxID=2744479 RepID=UPI0018F429A7|nr:VacJ family lipoprotein [Flocculibacter collagenilyticus]
MKNILLLIILSTMLAGCASTSKPNDPTTIGDERDPFEPINRDMWYFNWDILDENVLRPTAVAYSEYVPKPAREGLYNVTLNLEEPATIINSVLQLKFKKAGVSTGRFLINSTIGIFGIFDLASEIGLTREDEDFAQTLGLWGVGYGPYLMIPARGPSTVRGTVGDVVDGMYFPLALIEFWPNMLRLSVNALETRSQLMEQEKLLYESLDPYSFMKEIYFQKEDFQLFDGNVPIEEEAEEFPEGALDY